MIVCWGDDSVLGVVQCAVLCCAQQDRAGQGRSIALGSHLLNGHVAMKENTKENTL